MSHPNPTGVVGPWRGSKRAAEIPHTNRAGGRDKGMRDRSCSSDRGRSSLYGRLIKCSEVSTDLFPTVSLQNELPGIAAKFGPQCWIFHELQDRICKLRIVVPDKRMNIVLRFIPFSTDRSSHDCLSRSKKIEQF